MVAFLICALVLSIVYGVIVSQLYYRLWKSRETLQDRYVRKLKVHEESDLHFARIIQILNDGADGIGKRIADSESVVRAIDEYYPNAFKECKGLLQWLHANDHFLYSLYDSAADRIDPQQKKRVGEMRKKGRDEIFDRIYDRVQIPVPVTGNHEKSKQAAAMPD